MKIVSLFQRAKSSFKFWSAAPQVPQPPAPDFCVEDASERVARLKVPEPAMPRMHALVKLAPIPLPRAVRHESQAIYVGALVGTGLLVWGGFMVPVDWLLWYGAAALGVFALLFRIEGPLTRAERRAREHEVRERHEAYVLAEQRLKKVLHERFNERKEEFEDMQRLYDEAKKAVASIEAQPGSQFLSALANPFRKEPTPEEALAARVEELEKKMAALVAELEGFSDIHKEEIDAALMARHNARLVYWQAKLDEAVMTGEAVQQH